jgi:ABC-2 type transport system ATP-binding protein
MLQVQNLVKHFDQHKAVNDVSFGIERGKIFGLLGPNGAGKSTLLRMITGITMPDSGSILFDGKPFEPTVHSAQIGYMPEERGLYKKMKAGEQILYLAQLKGMSKNDAVDQAQKIFIELEMQSWWDKKVEDLSKGMSQKLQFVTTIMHKPKLLILDEPFSGLDPVNSNVIKEYIHKLAAEGTTIIFSTHRMEQVESMCDNIVLIHQGKNILAGNVKQIRQDYKQNIYSIQTQEPLYSNDIFEVIDNNTNLHSIKLLNEAAPNQALQYCISNNASISGFNEVLPTLNDIFIELVGHDGTRQFTAEA